MGTRLHHGASEKRGRSPVTYASGVASSIGQSNKAGARKPLPVFHTLKENAHLSAPKSPGYGFRKQEKIQEEFPTNSALDEMFVASHERFVALAHSILRN